MGRFPFSKQLIVITSGALLVGASLTFAPGAVAAGN